MRLRQPRPPLRRPRLQVEELDPRILYSADAAALLGLAGGPDAAVVREVVLAPPVQAQAQAPAREIVFIDSRVPDALALADQLMQQRGAGATVEIVMLDANTDGIAQIDRVLAGEHDLAAVHLISHGNEGAVQLGNSVLDADTLAQRREAVARWGDALGADGDLLLYGCNVAAGAAGQLFLHDLGALTGADVAASTGLTGSASLGGNWTLEFATGAIHTQLPPATYDALKWDGVLITYTVTNTNDSGNGSLRQAITLANFLTPGLDTIQFSISGTGVHTITLASLLPDITDAVFIDATTDDSFAANGNRPAIVLNGNNTVQDGLHLYTGSDGSTVRGLVIRNFTQNGIDISASNGNTIVGNWIGLDANGSTATAGNLQGVNIFNADNNLIGGDSAADRNVISGNTGLGISIVTNNGTGTGNLVSGNFIGTSANGLAALGNGSQGIYVNAAGNTIGGTAAGQGNVISGSLTSAGLTLQSNATGTLVAGNLIGLNATGTAALGNAGAGIELRSANNVIGGTSAAARNVIAGNAAYNAALLMSGASASGNVVIGNYIGTDISGTADLDGSALALNSSGVVITGGASNNRIGTNADGSNDALERNLISGTNWYGVEMIGATTTGNVVQGNYIGTTVTGLAPLGNANGGVSFWAGAHHNAVGSGLAGAGNVIAGNNYGVLLGNGATSNKVQGNLIGLGADGSTVVGNTGYGVYVFNGYTNTAVSGNVIGTDADGSNDAGERNVISGNPYGVVFENAEVTGNTIAGNYIGTDASGLLARGNTVDGVRLIGGANANNVGGSAAVQRNVIAANGGAGVLVSGDTSDSNSLRGNWIGVNAAGTATLGNLGSGIQISDADATVIGGTGVNDGNWIAGNGLAGIDVGGSASGTRIQGNRIGTDLAGTGVWGQQREGIWLHGGASGTLVGGTTAAAANLIAFNGQGGTADAGISVTDAGSLGHVFLGNSVYSNTGLGIDLGANGVTANDPGDADTGPNNLLNALVLSDATVVGGQLRVGGLYSGAANTSYRVEFFSNPGAEASGTGEGRTFLGFVNLPVGSSGTVSGSYTLAATVAAGSYISATVTRSDASYTTFYETSEFSNHVVARLPGITVTPTTGLATTEAGGTAQFSVVLDAAPTANVTIALSSSDASEGAVSTTLLTFTTANWNQAQLVTVTGVDDTVVDGSVAYTAITAAATSADAAYNGMNASDVALTNSDDDTVNTVTVDTTADTLDGSTASLDALLANRGADGRISLREAITAANNTANGSGGADRITFGIAGSGAQTIALTASLPTVTDTVTIDGWTQAGYSGTPLIVIDGEQLASIGLRLGANADGSVVRGLVLRDFSSEAIQIDTGASGNTIEGNYIGAFAPDGSDLGVSESNLANGIAVFGDHNTIGGTSAASRNVIGGNQGSGIRFTGPGATDNTVLNNLIGVNIAGTAAMGNGVDGVRTDASPVRNAIGVAGHGNVISGNGASGISLGGSQTSVQGNLIGLDISGTVAIANAGPGVRIMGSGNTLGGASAGAGNVISGNGDDGIFLTGAGLTGNVVTGNIIGTNAAGNAALGNGRDGIWVDTGVTATTITGNLISGNATRGVYLKDGGNTVAGNIIGLDASGTVAIGNAVGVSIVASGNTIGGAGVGAGNLIGGNLGAGVAMTGVTATGNAVIGNRFLANGGLAIDLGGDGVTANDASDADSGANNLQNFPVLATVIANASNQVQITGTLDSQANSFYRIEFFASTGADASGHGEGQRLLGFADVATDGAGHASFTTTLTASVTAGEFVSATATRSDAGHTTFTDTSEFAQNVVARAVNEAPAGSNTTVAAVEDTAYTFAAADFGYSDAGGDALQRVLITTLPGQGTLRLNGVAVAAGDAILANDIALGRLTYTPPTNANGAAYTSFTFQVQDDGGTGFGGTDLDATANTVVIDVAAVNDVPVNTVPATLTFAEDSPGAITGLSITDPDAGSSILRTELTVTGGTLAAASGGGVLASGSGTATLVLTGTLADLNAYLASASAPTFLGAADATGLVTLNMVTSDGRNDGTGGVVAAGTLDYRFQDGRPAGSEPNNVASSGGVVGVANNFSAGALAIALSGSNTSFGVIYTGVIDITTAGTYTFAVNADDAARLGVDGNPNFLAWHGSASSAMVLAAGRHTLEIRFAQDMGGAALGITVSGPDTGNLPTTLLATPGVGRLVSPTASTAITLTPVNDAPVLGFIIGNGNYAENAGALLLAPSATVADVDSVDFAGGQLIVQFSANGQAEDQLAVRDQGNGAGQIGVAGSVVSYGGTVIGSVSGGAAGSALVVTFNSNATVAAVQALARNLTYQNASDNPSTAVRSLQGWVSDGDGGTSNVAAGTLTVVPSNDAPVLTITPGSPSFNENAAAIVVDPGLTIGDVDNTTLTGASVRISMAYANGEDLLAFTDQLGISGSWNAASGTLTLSGSASVANYQTALRSVSYRNTSEDPGTAVRTVEFAVNDGTAASAAATRQVQVVSIDDAPTTAAASASGAEDAASIAVTLTGSDVDGTVNRFRLIDLPANGTLYLDAGLTTPAAIATDLAATAQALTLYFVPAMNWSGSTGFQFAARDAAGLTDATPATATIVVTAVNDAPVLTASGALATYTENTAAVSIDPGVTVSDIDTTAFAGGTLTVTLAAGGSTDDTLAVRHQGNGAGQIGVSGASLNFGGVVIGSAAGGSGGSALVITLNANADAAAVQALARQITFASRGDAVDTTPRTVRMLLTDGSGGSSANADTALQVVAVNDAPTIVAPASASVAEDGALFFGPGPNALVVQDADAATGPLSVTLTASHGTLTLAGTSGLSFAVGDGTDDTTLSFSGALADIDAALSGLRFAPAADYAGPASVRIDVDDLGNQGNGGPLTATHTVAVTVTPIDDAPSGAPSITGSAIEGQLLTADTAAIADADGLGAFSFEWQRNGVAIAGATASTYVPVNADVGAALRVRVSYVDGQGRSEQLVSASVGPVANVNDAPSGAPVIGGSATEDQMLTADTSTIADADGLGAFTLQWQRDGVAIVGANGTGYTLGDADVGTTIRVRVDYTDAHGHAEQLTSAALGPVANIDDAPSGAPVINGSATEDQTLSADTTSIADADGLGPFTLQWLRDGAAIAGATAANYTLGDADVGGRITLQVSTTDGHGHVESLTSAPTMPVENLNDAPTGQPVPAGVPAAGQWLVADTRAIADADALGTISYAWLRNGVAIDDATAASYRLVDADAGQAISVRMSYRDGHGTVEMVTSAALIIGVPADVQPDVPTTDAPATDAPVAATPEPAWPAGDAPAVDMQPGNPVLAAAPPSLATIGPLGADAPAVDPAAFGAAASGRPSAAPAEAVRATAPSSAPRIDKGSDYLDLQTRIAVEEVDLGNWQWQNLLMQDVSGGRSAFAARPSAAWIDPNAAAGDSASVGLRWTQTAAASGLALTAGTVWWALRAGGLLTSLMVSMPAWRHADLLAVLPDDEDEDNWDLADDEQARRDEEAVGDVFDPVAGGALR